MPKTIRLLQINNFTMKWKIPPFLTLPLPLDVKISRLFITILNVIIFSELIEGSVSTNLLVDGSTVTLLPRAETGLIVSKPIFQIVFVFSSIMRL